MLVLRPFIISLAPLSFLYINIVSNLPVFFFFFTGRQRITALSTLCISYLAHFKGQLDVHLDGVGMVGQAEGWLDRQVDGYGTWILVGLGFWEWSSCAVLRLYTLLFLYLTA